MSTQLEASPTVVSFFERLDGMSPLLRLLLGDGALTASFDIRGAPNARILLDATAGRIRVTQQPTAAPTAIRVAASAEIWAEVLSGRLAPGEAFGRRELLLRGSASELARMIPLLEFAPPLFRDHVAARLGSSPEATAMISKPRSIRSLVARPRAALARLASTGLHGAVFWTGYSLGRLRQGGLDRAALMDLLSSAARGWERAERPHSAAATKESAS